MKILTAGTIAGMNSDAFARASQVIHQAEQSATRPRFSPKLRLRLILWQLSKHLQPNYAKAISRHSQLWLIGLMGKCPRLQYLQAT